MFSILAPHDICENSDISRIAQSHLVKVLGLSTSLIPARLYFFASLHLCSRFVLSLLAGNIGCSMEDSTFERHGAVAVDFMHIRTLQMECASRSHPVWTHRGSGTHDPVQKGHISQVIASSCAMCLCQPVF